MHELEQQQEQKLPEHQREHEAAGKAAKENDRVFKQQDAPHMRLGKAKHAIKPEFLLPALHEKAVDGKQKARRKHREHDDAHQEQSLRDIPTGNRLKLCGHGKPAHEKVNAADNGTGDHIRQVNFPAAADIRPGKFQVKPFSQCPHPHPKARKDSPRSGRKTRGCRPHPGKAAQRSRHP